MRYRREGFIALVLAGCSVGGAGSRPDAGSMSIDDGGARTDARRAISDGGFVACETAIATAELAPTSLLFTVDTSGSMNCPASDPSCLSQERPAPSSRFIVFRTVLSDALAGLPSSTGAGLMHYPVTFSCARDELLTAIAPLATSRAEIESDLGAIVPAGITPTHDAVAYSLARLRARSADEARFVVLATDGAATTCIGCDAACSFDALDRDNDAMVDEVRAAARDEGIRTFVIGVPGSQSYRAVLSRMASAAGTAREGCSDAGPTYCHYDLTDPRLDFATALRAALGEIGEAVQSCEYSIPPNPDGAFDPTLVNVRILGDDGGETPVPRDRARARGWDYSDDGARILLHGPACDAAQALRTGRVEVRFGCPTELI